MKAVSYQLSAVSNTGFAGRWIPAGRELNRENLGCVQVPIVET